MNDFLEDEDRGVTAGGSWIGPADDPWMHFTITSDGVAIQGPDGPRDSTTGSCSSSGFGPEDEDFLSSMVLPICRPVTPSNDYEAASREADGLLHRRARDGEGSFRLDTGHVSLAGGSLEMSDSYRAATRPEDGASASSTCPLR